MQIQKEESLRLYTNRIEYIDVAKGIGMLFVVFGHVNLTYSLQVIIYSFHMPLFFILSGAVFRSDRYLGFEDFLEHKWRKTVIPYLFFSLAPIVGIYCMDMFLHLPINLTKENYINGIVQTFIAQKSTKMFNVPLWFVPCLLVTEGIYFFLSRWSRNIIIVASVILTCIGWFLQAGFFSVGVLPWSMDTALYAVGFFTLGNLGFPILKEKICILQKKKHYTAHVFVICFVCIALWLPLALFNGKVSMGLKIINNGGILYATGLVATIGILLFSTLLEKSKFLKFLGKNSFCIMSVHCLALNYVVHQVYKIMGIPLYDETQFDQTIFPFVAVLGLSVLISWIYNFAVKKLTDFRRKNA